MFAAIFFVTIGMLINIADFRHFILPAALVSIVFIIGKIIFVHLKYKFYYVVYTPKTIYNLAKYTKFFFVDNKTKSQ